MSLAHIVLQLISFTYLYETRTKENKNTYRFVSLTPKPYRLVLDLGHKIKIPTLTLGYDHNITEGRPPIDTSIIDTRFFFLGREGKGNDWVGNR